jgi:transposase InsO family protein
VVQGRPSPARAGVKFAAGLRVPAPSTPKVRGRLARERRHDRTTFLNVNEHHLRQVLTEYLLHYNTARPHRALGQLPPAQAHKRPREINLADYRIRRKQVLGGLIHEYQITA